MAPGEVQAPGTEQLVALERLAEQVDPPLCEVVLNGVRCGCAAAWFGRTACDTGGSFICDSHHDGIEELLARGPATCPHHGVRMSMVWTKL